MLFMRKKHILLNKMKAKKVAKSYRMGFLLMILKTVESTTHIYRMSRILLTHVDMGAWNNQKTKLQYEFTVLMLAKKKNILYMCNNCCCKIPLIAFWPSCTTETYKRWVFVSHKNLIQSSFVRYLAYFISVRRDRVVYILSG